VLVGNPYAGAPEIALQVQAASRQDPSIEWHGAVDDARLATEFERCAFTVYPSLVEGFGLPILESLWMGRPCLTHDGGVMAELGTQGGCVTVDMTDPSAIMGAMERMAVDRALLSRLCQEAKDRQIRTWQEYAHEISERLIRL
jgi:glycosyltransferase involved in cell wall biosynthesis